ncbi:MAG: virulence factor SrfB [Pirellulaceae bacterium]|jgi:hypothetical protein|nr:virulence factor SrfB [Pirellulaceae bacterium]MDP7015799.1 virulence factor SrfB [Pirellulaceae bacterium]
MQILFANTGVQVVCVPLPTGRRYTTSQIGYGWQYTRCLQPPDEEAGEEEPTVVDFPFVQWQILQSHASKLFLAVDTTMGDPEVGFFCDPTSLHGDFIIHLQDLIDREGAVLQGVPPVDLTLRASTATAGEAKPVHIVIDFGNSRTGALLLEMSGEVAQEPKMTPFELANRFTFDAFSDEGEDVGKPSARWISSKTRWCNAPYLPAQTRMKTEYYRETVKGLLGKTKQVTKERQAQIRPPLFDDLSLGRMGQEVYDVSQIMHAKGDFRLGVSSPKRYLWADDPSWLEGAFWYMADPHDRCETNVFAAKLQGSALKFLFEDDRDRLLDEKEMTDDDYAPEAPTKPQHAPRVMMVVAMYELLCQAYTHVNSETYRSHTSDPARSREIRSVTLTFPSGMFQLERERFGSQVQKAIEMFCRTLGKSQKQAPTLKLSIDEASAVHLTYIWSELQMLGQDPRLWFNALSRTKRKLNGGGGDDDASSEQGPAEQGAVSAGRRRNRGRLNRPGGGRAGGASTAEEETDIEQELRIACIDIGGGTTDLMIAKYTFQPGIDDSIHGQVLHQDGISVAGDQLVKRLLEKVVVPAFADALGIEAEDVLLLFGPEVPKNRGFTSDRIDWTNRIFVPIAESYLQMAVDGDEEAELSHTDPEIVDPAVLESLEQVCNQLRGIGYYNIQQPLGLRYEKGVFEQLVHEVFDDLLFDFCSRIVDHETDVVLLAGQPSKLEYLQKLVRTYVPLPSSRIVPMFNHYAGNWYPYQDAKGHAPGLIVDPKSAVVVGAAIEFLARNGMLPQFTYTMRGKQTENTYFWGVMTESTSIIRDERILFEPVEEDTRDEWTEFNTKAQRVLIGRKMVGDEEAQASPIYVLRMDADGRIGETDVTVRIRRNQATDEMEENLEVDSVTGMVAGEPAVLEENVTFKWRTIVDERFFLDTGGLDNIEID